MIADIASGHHAFGDVMFLVAVILAVVAGAVSWRPIDRVSGEALGWLAVASLSLALLVL